ncbi:hypothetical protein BDN70DRAFT_879150 [Pholiota conissans]|uniref:Heterokaryon incompatibility domain-containing protein n=1 Tax=Pholiota conissans TaxID=109636 RepID=A0A9P5Z1P8_9AGAR|nr:hypothetical protein BDN70DRAFT_879150 [Pholiota conissans]
MLFPGQKKGIDVDLEDLSESGNITFEDNCESVEGDDVDLEGSSQRPIFITDTEPGVNTPPRLTSSPEGTEYGDEIELDAEQELIVPEELFPLLRPSTYAFHLTRRDKLLGALRQHVFNAMPIRLLYLEQRESTTLKISLLERPEIYNQLSSNLRIQLEPDEFPAFIEQKLSQSGAAIDAEEKAIKAWVLKYARYAILSHTWIRDTPGEVTFADWATRRLSTDEPGYRKLVSFCRTVASEYGFTLAWMDTICINKDSSAELDESIRSMYKWYGAADLCVTYLAETTEISYMKDDSWFTRGWTLQELLAPHRIKFYSADWKKLVDSPISVELNLELYNAEWKKRLESTMNDKWNPDILAQIESATTITVEELKFISSVSISRRMQWAARRDVTREEDATYSLMGIMNVSIPIAYGEGSDRAFARLLKELLGSSKDILDILNWAGNIHSDASSLLPSGPQYYLYGSPKLRHNKLRPIEPVLLTHLGLQIPVLLLPALSKYAPVPAPTSTLPFGFTPIGDYYGTADIFPIGDHPTRYNLLDQRVEGRDGWRSNEEFQMTFGVLNFGGVSPTSIHIPRNCFAVGLLCYEDVGKVTGYGDWHCVKIPVKRPIVFQLNQTNRDLSREMEHTELTNHGMQLITLYL